MKNWLPLVLLGIALLFGVSSSAHASGSSPVLITGVYYDPFMTGEASEAIQLQNISSLTVNISNWTLGDDKHAVAFPAGATLAAHQKIWVSRSAAGFRQEFGSAPAYEYGGDFDASVPNMSGGALTLPNSGDVIYLKNDSATVNDAMAYGSATPGVQNWSGAAVQPFDFGEDSIEGQILYRKLREADGLPVADTNTANDWAQDPADARYGKRVAYPGWDSDNFFQTVKANDSSTIKYCVAPDNLFECMRDELLSATSTISMEMYSLDNANVVDVITQTMAAGVHVSLMVDGGALTAQGKWACQQIEARGGQCWIIASVPQDNIHKRYDSVHAKWLVIDHRRVLIGSENMGDDAMPADAKADGTFGTRGGYLITDSPTLVAALETLLAHDTNPARNQDVRRWGTNTDDFPPLGFKPVYTDGGKSYPVRFPTPLVLTGAYPIELLQCPDNCLRTSDALLGRLAQLGAGDTLLVEMLYEYPYWGRSSSNADRDPNPRLQAFLAAAQRGAQVRILLDSFYDTFSDPRSNFSTCAYVNQFAPRYDIQCRLGNPTGQGIHNKMILMQQGATAWVNLGSINGSETSNKLNRELATQVESTAAYAYWAQVFDADWATTRLAPHRQFLPLVLNK